ncbi:CbiX/SirB N-terminal domain-containing protein [Tsukamurella sp. 8F]|uniref:sirohydrochlorin chelatase n=1 Tax=unclassified Tsukamurella TaxID=2633480 RepID=UPI0023B8AB2B|nr:MULTISPECIES: CbiX/SirB N-terminal domain-containing protein [unclassified Tsukamurella]MDF0528907.1 CbiX/SirB N-terminal domain-containing protein [Tsukamurella sp. 8J]MDF0586742.1 CbiX/SirB N-terminal domain-containing protein [Tsukamurella sp. 8F]
MQDPTTATRRILVAHGTRSVRGVAVVGDLARAVAQRVGAPVAVAFVDVLGPSPRELLAADPRPTVLVPCFLAAGYHVHSDLPRHLEASGHPSATASRPLGPDPALACALVRRLREAGWVPGDRVVLGATGSSDPRARDDVRRMAAMLAAEVGDDVPHGFQAAGEPLVSDAVAAVRREVGDAGAGRVFVASYQLAPGLFHSRLADAGADGVTAPLGVAPEVVGLIAERFTAAATHVAQRR